jgi:hypothetical protein
MWHKHQPFNRRSLGSCTRSADLVKLLEKPAVLPYHPNVSNVDGRKMNFYDKDWTYIGTKDSLTPQIKRITCISLAHLINAMPFQEDTFPFSASPSPYLPDANTGTPAPPSTHVQHRMRLGTRQRAHHINVPPSAATCPSRRHCAWPGSRVTTRPNHEFQQRAGRPGSGDAGCELASIQRPGEACDTLPMPGLATKNTIILSSI